jgi:predicted dehydrogenase
LKPALAGQPPDTNYEKWDIEEKEHLMTEPDKPKYRVGAIGCGRQGTVQMRAYNLHPNTEVVAAADPDRENLDLFCERFGVPGYSSYQEMLEKEDIDIAGAVLPVSPNAEVVIGCARLGVKAIFCEKTLAVSLEDADRAVDECRSRGIPLQCGNVERNAPQLWKAREMIAAGELGDVHSINIYRASDEMNGGGCGPANEMRMFAGDAEADWAIGRVSGVAGEDSIGWSRSDTVRGGWTGTETLTVDESSDLDQGLAGYVRFTNGIDAYLHHSPSCKYGVEVVCSKGLFYSDRRSYHLWKLGDVGHPGRPKWDELEKVEGLFTEKTMGMGGYDEEGWRTPGSRALDTVQSVVDSLEKGTKPRNSGEDVLKSMEIIFAMRESHRQGFTAVKLPLQDRSLKMIPKNSRMFDKKQVRGAEWYAEQIASLKNG